tara:strand:- start:750 stop:1082 length:333 start_codon:yes stop_codon:yes gene_type:complete
MGLIAKDFHFYTNSKKQTTKYNNFLDCHYADLDDNTENIRIFGTEEQVEETKNKYIEETGLALDEVYIFEEEPKDSFFYNKAANDIAAMKLEMYEKMYNTNKQKPLIIRI